MNEEQKLIDTIFLAKLRDTLRLEEAEEALKSAQRKNPKSQAEIEWAKQYGLKFAAKIWENDNTRI